MKEPTISSIDSDEKFGPVRVIDNFSNACLEFSSKVGLKRINRLVCLNGDILN